MDLEDGELDVPESSKQMGKMKVPSPPPSPTQDGPVDQDTTNSLSKKDRKKQMQAFISEGQKVSKAAYKAVLGYQATPSVKLTQADKPIRPTDIQGLLLWILADRKESKNPQWLFVQNVPLISQVVLLFVPGISMHLLQSRKELMPSCASLGLPVTVLAKDSNVRPVYTIGQLLSIPLSKEKQQYLKQASQGLEAQNGQQSPFPASHYVLNQEMMSKLGYPVTKDGLLPEGFVETRVSSSAQEQSDGRPSKIVAMDCEMCETLPNVYELTRLTLLDEAGKVLVDELVVPDNKITDYHTDKSGISESTLQGVTTKLKDAQQKFLEVVDRETLLVGHALENDLKATMIVHNRCIDTGALFPHPKFDLYSLYFPDLYHPRVIRISTRERSPPALLRGLLMKQLLGRLQDESSVVGLPFRTALRRITLKFLKRTIQEGEHDSITDAKAALDLFKLKLKHGPEFGLDPGRGFESVIDVLARANRSCCLVDRPDTLNKFLTGDADGIPCCDDAEVCQKLSRAVQKQSPEGKTRRFVWGQLRNIAQLYESRAQRQRLEAAAQRAGSTLQQSNGHDSVPIRDSRGDSESELKRTREDEKVLESAKVARTAGRGDVAEARDVSKDLQDEAVVGIPAACLEGEEDKEEGQQEESEEEALLKETDQHIQNVYNALPEDTLFIVASCQGDTANSRLVMENRAKRKQGIESPPWTTEEEKHYTREIVEHSVKGFCLVSVKQ